MNTKLAVRFLLWLLFSLGLIALAIRLDAETPKPDMSGWCCACMCGSKAQDKCAMHCIRMTKPGSPIIEEPEMRACTRECKEKFASPDREKKPGSKAGTERM